MPAPTHQEIRQSLRLTAPKPPNKLVAQTNTEQCPSLSSPFPVHSLPNPLQEPPATRTSRPCSIRSSAPSRANTPPLYPEVLKTTRLALRTLNAKLVASCRPDVAQGAFGVNPLSRFPNSPHVACRPCRPARLLQWNCSAAAARSTHALTPCARSHFAHFAACSRSSDAHVLSSFPTRYPLSAPAPLPRPRRPSIRQGSASWLGPSPSRVRPHESLYVSELP